MYIYKYLYFYLDILDLEDIFVIDIYIYFLFKDCFYENNIFYWNCNKKSSE